MAVNQKKLSALKDLNLIRTMIRQHKRNDLAFAGLGMFVIASLTITLIILLMSIRSNGIEKYALITVFGGASGNIFDRIYYSAVPDFIDFHIGDFHWFIFNIADIFITIGVICLIYVEIFIDKIKNEK
jgi:lipoprotein signal peptidase